MYCRVCGKIVSSYKHSGRICSDECYHQAFWRGLSDTIHMTNETHEGYHSIRIDKTQYVTLPEDEEEIGLKGSAGKTFYIVFTAGSKKGGVLKTSNLLNIGKIPEKYVEAMANNAKFITEEDYVNASKYMVGNKVRIKTWDKLVEEFGYNEAKNRIDCIGCFVDKMKSMCGRELRIERVDYDRKYIQKVDGYNISFDMIEGVE